MSRGTGFRFPPFFPHVPSGTLVGIVAGAARFDYYPGILRIPEDSCSRQKLLALASD